MKKFFDKVDINSKGANGCWEWIACKSHGYGRFGVKGRIIPAHRISYEYFNNTIITENLVIDHICRNRACVRPDHLRLVTRRTNAIENSTSIAAINISKTHCVNGHRFTEDNVYAVKENRRECRVCRREHDKRRRGTEHRKNYMAAFYQSRHMGVL